MNLVLCCFVLAALLILVSSEDTETALSAEELLREEVSSQAGSAGSRRRANKSHREAREARMREREQKLKAMAQEEHVKAKRLAKNAASRKVVGQVPEDTLRDDLDGLLDVSAASDAAAGGAGASSGGPMSFPVLSESELAAVKAAKEAEEAAGKFRPLSDEEIEDSFSFTGALKSKISGAFSKGAGVAEEVDSAEAGSFTIIERSSSSEVAGEVEPLDLQIENLTLAAVSAIEEIDFKIQTEPHVDPVVEPASTASDADAVQEKKEKDAAPVVEDSPPVAVEPVAVVEEEPVAAVEEEEEEEPVAAVEEEEEEEEPVDVEPVAVVEEVEKPAAAEEEKKTEAEPEVPELASSSSSSSFEPLEGLESRGIKFGDDTAGDGDKKTGVVSPSSVGLPALPGATIDLSNLLGELDE
jgi:hypothetical protein